MSDRLEQLAKLVLADDLLAHLRNQGEGPYRAGISLTGNEIALLACLLERYIQEGEEAIDLEEGQRKNIAP